MAATGTMLSCRCSPEWLTTQPAVSGHQRGCPRNGITDERRLAAAVQLAREAQDSGRPISSTQLLALLGEPVWRSS